MPHPAGAGIIRPVNQRRNEYDVTNRVNVEVVDDVRDAVLEIFAARYPGEDLAPLWRAFDDMKALFAGRYPGYLACDTLYHDLRHTLDMTLATARLIDGHDRTCAAADIIVVGNWAMVLLQIKLPPPK